MQKQISTAQFAAELSLSPETLRTAVCKHGSYFGVVPAKSLNGRLLWPVAELERLKGGAK